MPSYSYETTMTTTSTSSSSSRAKSESRCSSVSSKVGFWQLEEMQEEQFQIQRQIWYQTASKDSVDIFSQKAGWGVLLWTEPLRWGETAAGKVHGKDFFRLSELWKEKFLWFSHSCLRKWYMDSSTFKAFFHCRCAIKSLKILSNREFYYPPHIALSGNYYPRFQMIKIFKFIVTSFRIEESKLWMVSGTKLKATLRQALPMWPT